MAFVGVGERGSMHVGQMAVIEGAEIVGICAVSYTHLDVYKRQFIYREHDFIPPGSCMKECMRNLPLSPFLHMLKPWNVQAVHPLGICFCVTLVFSSPSKPKVYL